MSRSFAYDRFDVHADGDGYISTVEEANSEGNYVKAQDALDREAVLQARIRTLETQLKDSREEARISKIRYEATLPRMREAD